MTKTYALKRLLEHGAMTPSEIKACTRWPGNSVYATLHHLRLVGAVRRICRTSGDRQLAYVAVR